MLTKIVAIYDIYCKRPGTVQPNLPDPINIHTQGKEEIELYSNDPRNKIPSSMRGSLKVCLE